MSYIKTFAELGKEDVAIAGGKAANLGEMINAGLPVPAGFCILTNAYNDFVNNNNADIEIKRIMAHLDSLDMESLAKASGEIAAVFRNGIIPENISVEIKKFYHALSAGQDNPAVAVRSSATAEDMPDFSFAGQQETFLNRIGVDALLESVKACWASLWTARAIGYRAKNNIPADELALAVAVQLMVQSDASGVLFTANPLNGRLTETVIDATVGLGEALVSGQVDPDHYVVDSLDRKIIGKTIGEKKLSVRSVGTGGTVVQNEVQDQTQALSDSQILELTEMGRKAAVHYGNPQDIEWAYAGGQLYLLQSRAITSLYPLPDSIRQNVFTTKDVLKIYLSFASWQGMMDPITPIGQEVFAGLAAGVGRTRLENQKVFMTAGERLFVDFTPIVRHPVGRKAAVFFIDAIEPSVSGAIKQLHDDPRLCVIKKRMKINTFFGLLEILGPIAFNTIRNLIRPQQGRLRMYRKAEKALRLIRSKKDRIKNLRGLADFFEGMLELMPPKLLPHLIPAVSSGQAPLQILIRIASRVPEADSLLGDLSRGLPHNVTTEMDLKLWDISVVIKSSGPDNELFLQKEAIELSALYLEKRLPEISQAALDGFMESYGMRGPGEIDMGRPRWKENPVSILQVLKSYLLIDESKSPRQVFKNGALKSKEAADRLFDLLRKSKGGFFRARLARMLYKRVTELGGLRELPKFFIIKIFDIFRGIFLEWGKKLVSEGLIEKESDIFFLRIAELRKIELPRKDEFRTTIHDRKVRYEREKKRKLIPRLLLSDGTVFYEGMKKSNADEEGVLTGSPVSAGIAEGIVHVVLDPSVEKLLPGEILVCPATDPGWTPLFLSAGGLIMEVGGMMTHGSVVAREYGIPAVVGVHRATTRLVNGQRIRMDGSSGRIEIMQR